MNTTNDTNGLVALIRSDDANEPLDSFPAMGTIIGAVRINKPFTQHYDSYECAAWWEDREAIPGIYPILLQRSYHHPRFLVGMAKVQAKVTDDYFPGLWCGNHISNKPYVPKHIGESREIPVGCSLAELIDRHNVNSEDKSWFIHPRFWLLALEEAETELHCAVDYLIGTKASRYEFIEHTYARGAAVPVERPGCYNEFLSGDTKYESHLSAVSYAGQIIAKRGKEIQEIRRRLGYLGETSDMWRRLYNANSQWALQYLGINDLSRPFPVPSSPLRPNEIPWNRVSKENPRP